LMWATLLRETENQALRLSTVLFNLRIPGWTLTVYFSMASG
jgi:hypothetical protein